MHLFLPQSHRLHLLEILSFDKALRHFCSKAAEVYPVARANPSEKPRIVRWMLTYFRTHTLGRVITPYYVVFLS